MPAKNRYAFLLSEKGDVAKNVSDIYTQLQAPGQRKAVEESLNKSVRDSSPTTRTVRVNDEPILLGYETPFVNSYGELQQGNAIYDYPFHDEYVVTPAANPVGYAAASANAATAAYAKTINPAELARLPGRDFQSPGYIANAYINPASEGAYDVSPAFNSSGRQLAGIGKNRRPTTQTDKVLQDLEIGPSGNMNRYNNALASNALNASYAQDYSNAASLAARSRAGNNYYAPSTSFLGNANRFGDPIQGTGNSSYEKARNISSGYAYPIYNVSPYQTFGTLPVSPEQQQAVAYQRSQTGMSQSFYRGGHDNPSSFPSGYSGYGL